MDKPPCFMCGKESEAWIIRTGKKRRVCADCGRALAETILNQGDDAVLINAPEKGQVAIFKHERKDT